MSGSKNDNNSINQDRFKVKELSIEEERSMTKLSLRKQKLNLIKTQLDVSNSYDIDPNVYRPNEDFNVFSSMDILWKILDPNKNLITVEDSNTYYLVYYISTKLQFQKDFFMEIPLIDNSNPNDKVYLIKVNLPILISKFNEFLLQVKLNQENSFFGLLASLTKILATSNNFKILFETLKGLNCLIYSLLE